MPDTHQHCGSLDVSSVIDVEAAETVTASDGVGHPAVVRVRRFLAVGVLGTDGGHEGVDWHVFGNPGPHVEVFEPENNRIELVMRNDFSPNNESS